MCGCSTEHPVLISLAFVGTDIATASDNGSGVTRMRRSFQRSHSPRSRVVPHQNLVHVRYGTNLTETRVVGLTAKSLMIVGLRYLHDWVVSAFRSRQVSHSRKSRPPP